MRCPFLATGRALVDMEKGQMKFRWNNEEMTFNICRSLRQSRLGVKALAAVIVNFDSDYIEEYGSLFVEIDRCFVRFKTKKLELDMKHRESPPRNHL